METAAVLMSQRMKHDRAPGTINNPGTESLD